MEAVSHQRDDRLGVGHLLHQPGVELAEALQGRGHEQRVQRGHFQLVADRAVDRVGLQEMVGVDALRRAGVAVHPLRHDGGGHAGGVQEGAPADPLIRVGHLAAQQQRRTADSAGREHAVTGAHHDLVRPRPQAARVQRRAFEARDFVLLDAQPQCPCAADQHGALGQCSGNGGDEHGLLGLRGTAQPAVAEVPAARDIALHGPRGNAKTLRATPQSVVVGIGRSRPRCDIEPALHHREPGRQLLDGELGEPEAALPVLQRRRRRAEAAGPVDRGRAPDAASLQDADALVLGLAAGGLLVELRVGLRLEHVEIRAAAQRPLLDHHHAQPRLREDLRRGPAARAGAHDRHVGVELQVGSSAGRHRAPATRSPGPRLSHLSCSCASLYPLEPQRRRGAEEDAEEKKMPFVRIRILIWHRKTSSSTRLSQHNPLCLCGSAVQGSSP